MHISSRMLWVSIRPSARYPSIYLRIFGLSIYLRPLLYLSLRLFVYLSIPYLPGFGLSIYLAVYPKYIHRHSICLPAIYLCP